VNESGKLKGGLAFSQKILPGRTTSNSHESIQSGTGKAVLKQVVLQHKSSSVKKRIVEIPFIAFNTIIFDCEACQ